MNRKSVKYVVTGMSWEGNFKFDEDGKIEDTYGYANERTWKLESFHIKSRRKRTKTADAAVVVPRSKKQARLSSSRACYFCSKYLEKSCITLDISDNSFTSYSFSAFIIRAISKSRSVTAGLPLMLFFSAEAPSR